MSELLCARGIDSKDAYNKFIDSSLPTDDDPYALSDMELAVQTIRNAIEKQKYICIYGDYDVDGVCATTILYKVLIELTPRLSYYIPSRHTEGYGMHEDSIRKLAQKGVGLIITVDNGISAVKEAELAYSLGMDLVITDHHRFSGELPIANAIVASSRNGYSSEINDLSGAGVAWMVARALTGQRLLHLLPYVALAIAADSVNVTGYNRAYLKNAFPLFNQEEHFKLLLEKAAFDEASVSMFTLNFVIAPRINAAGRLAHANIALQYFLSNDPEEMDTLSDQLEILNKSRKTEESRIYAACIKTEISDRNVLIFYGDDWNTGVVGIVASRLVEFYHKNVFVLGKTDSGKYVGSGRSDSNTDLYALLLPCANTLERFGGHAGAAGITVSEKNLEPFILAINDSYNNMFPNGAPIQYSEYDIDIGTNECSVPLAQEVKILAPFGPGNPEPVFRFANARLSNITQMGKEKEHLSALACNSNSDNYKGQIRLVAFKSGNDLELWRTSDNIDVLVNLSVNSFRGKDSCESRCVAFKSGIFSGESNEFIQLVNAFYTELRYNECRSAALARKICESLEYPIITENRLKELYILLRDRSRNLHSEHCIRSGGTSEEMAALLIFKELNLIQFDRSKILFLNVKTKANCQSSILFKTLNTK